MQIQSIGYVGIFASDLSAWEKFACDVFGLQVEDTAGRLSLRLDERAQGRYDARVANAWGRRATDVGKRRPP